MPRRPRPATRRPPHANPPRAGKKLASATKDVKIKPSRRSSEASRKFQRAEVYASSSGLHSESESEEDDEEGQEESGSSAEDVEGGDEQEFSDVDLSAPRVSQWVDDEELDAEVEDEDESEEESDEDGDESRLTKSQQSDLASLPFGALRKAQRALAQATAVETSEDEGSAHENAPEQGSSHYDLKGKGKEATEPAHSKHEISKRKNKHAPMEVTSKRPVPRKRLAEGEKLVARDPRFLPLAGEFSSQKFQVQYGFLSEMHVGEVKTLKDNLKRARKLLASSPRDLREEREQEVQRLERALKRAESMVNKDKREKIEHEALRKVGKEEREKRKEGKGAWYMKSSDKKELLLRAKYEALEATGGKGAVRKAIEKKQKKVSQQEKKRRPGPYRTGGGKRARAGEEEGSTGGKRRRVD